MNTQRVVFLDKLRDNFFSNLDCRDAALWVNNRPISISNLEKQVAAMGLPWRMVVSENSDPSIIQRLEDPQYFEGRLIRKRGFVQILDSDPSRLSLPQRCLPVYLLNGRGKESYSPFEDQLRRVTMLEDVRRTPVRDLVILSDDQIVPEGLKELWANGFRANLIFITNSEAAAGAIEEWIEETNAAMAVSLLLEQPSSIINAINDLYWTKYPEDRVLVRIRDVVGDYQSVDFTELDDPERPILSDYSIIEERHLGFVPVDSISQEDFAGFFHSPETSWRPYAAGLPWIPNTIWPERMDRCIKKLDVVGSEETCIAYISAEPGAGGTTMARTLAWKYASKGYPVLVAKPIPFAPNSATVASFLSRAHQAIQAARTAGVDVEQRGDDKRRYETPWIIVFDRIHWDHRDSELRMFCKDLMRLGRPVCILVVADSAYSISYSDKALFKGIGRLSHAISKEDVVSLGFHLNKFLRNFSREKTESQWNVFYEEHTVQYLNGVASFWVALSFWIQGQYNLSESIQEWVYRSYKENVKDVALKRAIVEIAAMGSERLPLPEGLLPASVGEWPMSHLLEEARAVVPGLGLTLVHGDGREKYWALVHDILGRLLLNAIFYDPKALAELGLDGTNSLEYLRFSVLREIAHKKVLGEREFQTIGEDFATSIFKVDPDHGRGNFVFFWREVLEALDGMPQPLRDTSRVFRHHSSISRRRIAKLDEEYYGVSVDDKVELLETAVNDILYALESISPDPGSEPNLNLYNSLARAYHDLAELEDSRGGDEARVVYLRAKFNETTRKAYDESPDNPFVVETYVRNLLANAKLDKDSAVPKCIDALGILYTALLSSEINYRRSKLSRLADKAFAVLLSQRVDGDVISDPESPIDVLLNAWVILSKSSNEPGQLDLSELSAERKLEALEALGHPVGRGNIQILKLRYQLLCTVNAYDFEAQIECMDQIAASDYDLRPQFQLEYAILLYQVGRTEEGDKLFRKLRVMWRESEHFIQVPGHLRWLRDIRTRQLKTTTAIIGSDHVYKPMARVQLFQNQKVPFRPYEFGLTNPKPRQRFQCNVSFGHNGPFLRPLTAGAR